jgi:hypothetical protein
MGEQDMFICKEDAKKYFGSKQFIAPMQKTTCDVCGKDKECYNIPYKVSMREIAKKGQADIQKAKELGAIAFAKGIKRVPALDKALMNMLEGFQVGDSRTLPIMNAWTQGWDKANLA